MGTLGKTSQIYLQEFEHLPESDIARKVGVSRQRIHELERKFRLCTMAPKSPKLMPEFFRPCPICGNRVKPGCKYYCSNLCRKKSTLRLKLTCFICGKEFVRSWSQAKRYKRSVCSGHCRGVYICRVRWGKKTKNEEIR